MQKFKIFTTILILYEFVILTILQMQHYCVSVFNTGFCNISFKYFLMCIVIPTLFVLFAWWWPDMKRKMCNKCQCEQENQTKEEMEHIITAAIIMGIQKFMTKYPKTKGFINDIIKILTTEKQK